MNEKIIFSVKEVFSDKLLGKSGYIIPDYQRGYKWIPENVCQLLEDILRFKQAESEQFYCLQNITLCLSDDKTAFKVIDGQQRLTTLFILLCYLGYSELVSGKLSYDIRTETARFLKEDICQRKCWDSSYKHDVIHQDEYYILNAAKTIQDWFEKDKTIDEIQSLRACFIPKLLEHTKLIVNDVTGNEYKTFSNLNGVRVPLDASDLIRAMLITYSVKEDRAGIDLDPYRARMGSEIDSMDKAWGGDNVKSYYTQFLPNELSRKAKNLRFDLSEHPIDLLYLLFLTVHKNEEEISMATFEDYLKSGKDTFKSIKDFHNDMMDWFNTTSLYHYVGYLLFNFKGASVSGFGKIDFRNVYAIWENSPSKNAFLKEIKKLIALCLLKDSESNEDRRKSGISAHEHFVNSIKFNVDTNWYVSPLLPNVLILNDIIISERSKSLERIPASYLRANSEDREHIGCQTPNKNDINNKERWLSDIAELEKFEVPEEQKQSFLANIHNLKNKIQLEDEITDEIKNDIISSLTQFGLNSIGNIVLLNESVNRGYGNGSFVEKRRAILNNYFNEKPDGKRALASKNKYIRPYTLKTFLSNLSSDKEAKNQWTLSDIKKNANEVATVINTFISESR